MDDLLDSAQKKIDDAAKAVEPAPSSPPGEDASTPTAPPPTPAPQADDTSTPIAQSVPAPSPMSIPPEPAPEAPISEIEEKKEETPTSEAAPSENASAIVDTLLSTPATMPKEEKQENASAPETDTTEKQAQEAVPPPPPKKKRSKAAIVAALLLFLVTLPLTVFYVAQQRQLADVRSLARIDEPCRVCQSKTCATIASGVNCNPERNECSANADCGATATAPTKTPTPARPQDEGDGVRATATATKAPTKAPTKTPTPGSTAGSCSGCAQKNYRWDLRDGECKKVYDASCNPDNPPAGQRTCTGYGAAGCNGRYPGASCGDGGECVMSDLDNGGCSCQGSGSNDTAATATPKPTTAPQCRNIKIYKDSAIVDPTTLRAGDAVVLSVKGDTSATKGRIRVNGGTFTESTTKNASNEYTVDFTIPSGVTTFTVEAEVFISGAWR